MVKRKEKKAHDRRILEWLNSRKIKKKQKSAPLGFLSYLTKSDDDAENCKDHLVDLLSNVATGTVAGASIKQDERSFGILEKSNACRRRQ
jgi:hypothetical protein